MSWQAMVQADSTETWASNGLRFATQKEAEDYVSDLACRWMAVRKTRVVESTDAVSHKFVDGKVMPVEDSQL